jgi:hypothetical protein
MQPAVGCSWGRCLSPFTTNLKVAGQFGERRQTVNLGM